MASSNKETHTNAPPTVHDEGAEVEAALRKQSKLIGRSIALSMTLKSAIELGILDIIAEAGDGAYLSASDVAGRIQGLKNPGAPEILERMMGLLSTFSLLECKLTKNDQGFEIWAYGIAPLAKYFLIRSGKGAQGPMFLLHHDKVILDSWNKLTEAVLEGGGRPFKKAHGMGTFQYTDTDPRFNRVFNQAMSSMTLPTSGNVLDVYQGFQGIKTLVDVGGGIGTNLTMTLPKWPNITKGINFDLPHVIAEAPEYKGVEHVGGDMFEKVPSGDAIFMKGILHDWNDEQCLKILRNCWKALPKFGKVVIVESTLPTPPKNEVDTQLDYLIDMILLVETPSGKSRTEQEFKALALKSGFSDFQVACNSAYGDSIMEFRK